MLTSLLCVAIALLACTYLWVRHYYSYWRRKGVPSIAPNYIFGNFTPAVLMKRCPGELLTDLYNHEKARDEPFVGIHVFHQPVLLLRNLELIKQVLVTDFSHFSNRFTVANARGDVVGNYNLLHMKNPGWKHLRTKITPVFSSVKIKLMFGLVDETGKHLDSCLSNHPLSNPDDNSFCLDFREICARYTTDVIASVGFGLSVDSLKDSETPFRRLGRDLFQVSIYRAIELTTLFFLPKLVSLFNARFFQREITDFFTRTTNDVIKEREKRGLVRNDLIDTLIAIKDSKIGDFAVTNDMLVGQVGGFFSAGFEATSAAMTFGLYELAKQPELQKRLRNEIHENLKGGITYESLNRMEYLNMVVQEILRLYPTLPFLDRECSLFEGEDGYSLAPFGDFKVPHGMPVYIPIRAIHRDPQYFADPNLFNPERFSAENKASIVSGSYLPFGSGPHNCIGERLGLMKVLRRKPLRVEEVRLWEVLRIAMYSQNRNVNRHSMWDFEIPERFKRVPIFSFIERAFSVQERQGWVQAEDFLHDHVEVLHTIQAVSLLQFRLLSQLVQTERHRARRRLKPGAEETACLSHQHVVGHFKAATL